jgi:hypothetical protein
VKRDASIVSACACPMLARHIASTGRGPVTCRERVPETVRFKYRAFLSCSHPDTGSANMTGLQAELEAALGMLHVDYAQVHLELAVGEWRRDATPGSDRTTGRRPT